jgi:hypothetical protein
MSESEKSNRLWNCCFLDYALLRIFRVVSLSCIVQLPFKSNPICPSLSPANCVLVYPVDLVILYSFPAARV